MSNTVLLIGTLDTRGREVAYVRDRLVEMGMKTLVLDSGILGEPVGLTPDIPREQVARAAGSNTEWLRNTGSRAAALDEMKKGIRRYALELFARGRVQGVVCLGGADGAAQGAAAMMALPIGVPKIVVTPIVAGRRHFGTLTGTRDIMVVHSVVDLTGLNPVSRSIYDNVAAALVGMIQRRPTIVGKGGKVNTGGKRYAGITMLDSTGNAVARIKEQLHSRGVEGVVFHANGAGGPAMEELAEMGMFAGVIDYTTGELSGQLLGGFHQGGERRLERVGALGLPQVIVPGCVDFTVHGPRDEVPSRLRNRPMYSQDPETTYVRLTHEEMEQVGRVMAQKLNKATGPLTVLVPTRGLSLPNAPAGPFWDPGADFAFLRALMLDLRKGIKVITVEAHVDDEAFAGRVAAEFLKMLSAGQAATAAHQPQANSVRR
jgi:uncharacterized protein (UPF0261 family)